MGLPNRGGFRGGEGLKLKTIAHIMKEIKANSLDSPTPIVISTLWYDFPRTPVPTGCASLENRALSEKHGSNRSFPSSLVPLY